MSHDLFGKCLWNMRGIGAYSWLKMKNEEEGMKDDTERGEGEQERGVVQCYTKTNHGSFSSECPGNN